MSWPSGPALLGQPLSPGVSEEEVQGVQHAIAEAVLTHNSIPGEGERRRGWWWGWRKRKKKGNRRRKKKKKEKRWKNWGDDDGFAAGPTDITSAPAGHWERLH